MPQHFEVMTPLFEGQAHERYQFKLNIEGNDYRGIFHNQEISWFQPHPHHQIEKEELDSVESNVRDWMTNRFLH